MKVQVDNKTCAGHGICVILAPTVFDFDDNGRARVIADPIPEDVENDALTAIADCPARAITRVDE